MEENDGDKIISAKLIESQKVVQEKEIQVSGSEDKGEKFAGRS